MEFNINTTAKILTKVPEGNTPLYYIAKIKELQSRKREGISAPHQEVYTVKYLEDFAKKHELEHLDDHEVIKWIVTNFNNTLKKGERPRRVVAVWAVYNSITAKKI